MRSTVIIEYKTNSYRATVQGRFGGGYRNANAGATPEDAAAFAAREMIGYSQGNPDGGSLLAPPEVMILVPAHLYSIEGRATPQCPHCGGEINPASLMGKASSEAKAVAARENARKPRPGAKGKPKPRKPKNE